MNAIASADKNWGIGFHNGLLLRIPDDMKCFREMTMGKAIVMGRKTQESLPGGYLPGRVNIVLTHDKNYQAEGIFAVHSIEELYRRLEAYHTKDVFVIGGESIYRQLLDDCETVYLTKIDAAFDADAFFPNLDESPQWALVSESGKQAYHQTDYRFCRYENRKYAKREETMDITGRKLFVKALREEGVDTIFGYPGGMVTDIFDELYKQEDIQVVLPRHEQGLIFEAEGYAKATGKPGVCLVTSGPGATNIITGLADAHYDSIPLVCITGQVPLSLIGNDAFQEVDIVGMTRSVTKYGVTVRERKDLGRILKMAFHIAQTGKLGPVLIDIPKDIQMQSGDSEYPSQVHIRGYKPNESVHIGQLKKAYRLLKSAKRPLILAGGGIHIGGAQEQLQKFAERTQIPVVTTVMGKGAMPPKHPLYLGNSGMHGKYACNIAVSQCDLLFSIGTRFNDRITGDLNEFAPHARIIHIDVDTAAISRNVVVDVPIVADAKLALEKLCEWAEKQDTEKWIAKIRGWETENPLEMRRDRGMTPQMIMEAVNRSYKEAIIVSDVGQHQMWASQYLEIGGRKKLITSGGLGSMGFGLPAAIGAKIGKPYENVICITGDGGFQMNMQEMATAIAEKAPVTICLLNNQYLGMVRQMQQLFYGKRYEATCLRRQKGCPDMCKGPNEACPPYVPDFVKFAQCYGAYGIRVTEPSQIEDAFYQAKHNADAPTLIEFLIAADELVLPMVKGGNPMSEMILK